MSHSVCKWRYSDHKLNVRRFPTLFHLITNLAYNLKSHQTRNQYLRARLNTCAYVNIMPASVYKLVFNDPEFKKLGPSTLEIGTCITDTVKIVGACIFYLVYPDTKKLQEVSFYVAQNDGSVLLSCTTIVALGLIQPHTRLDYLPHRASFITSSVDHPKKTKRVSVHSSRKEVSTQSKQLQFPNWWQANFTKLPRCFWGYWMLYTSSLSYTVRSNYYTQADTL